MAESETNRAAAAIWKIESPRLIATLTRLVRDVGLAEDLAQDAFVDALERWEHGGIPDRPGAWLMTAARHLAIDALRRGRRIERKHEQLASETEEAHEVDRDAPLDDVVGDDLLRLVFVACHPVLAREARVALTLRLLGGLTTSEIARAFLVPEPTIAQRIVRAKRTLADERVPFELPTAADLAARLDSVLEVVYLVFNEGYAATVGDDWLRPALCDDAMRLGRTLVELMPRDAEVRGLLALMEIQASRSRARVGPNGEAVLLEDQDRSRWDAVLVRRGLEGIAIADGLVVDRPGPYLLQAAIAGGHASARTAGETDWARIAVLYDALARVAPSPVVELNRAVAHARVFGPGAGLRILDAVAGDPALRDYPFADSVRAELLTRAGRHEEALAALERATALTQNASERATLTGRAAAIRKARSG